jgi:pyruvate/2-oxoglutarate dehydrogenase complex dihydrolipoamide dehydrogenase (E3) component
MDLDLLVIGSGPGGQRAAIQAAKLGKRVAVVERRDRVGGVSIHSGTIPSAPTSPTHCTPNVRRARSATSFTTASPGSSPARPQSCETNFAATLSD